MKAGIGKATLSRWEAGRTLPRITELERVLDALNVSTARRQEALFCLQAPRALERLRQASQDVPLRGDLLRAMRLRLRRTQVEVAAEIGVSQSTLARWEATEDWPSVERLHALCYALEAHEDELVALTRGHIAPPSPVASEISWETCWPRILEPLYNSETYVLGDLVFHSVESDLWKMAETGSPPETWLAMAYAYHARWLSEFGRDQEAMAAAQRALRRVGDHPQPQDDWLNAAVMLARSLAHRGRYPEAIGLLRACLPRAHQPGYRAWLPSELALCLSEAGYADSALRLSRQALRIARQEVPLEFCFRCYDHAEILLRSGQPAEALKWLSPAEGEIPPWDLTVHLLLTARTLLALERFGEGQSYLQRAQQLAERYGLTHLQEQIEAVVRQYGPNL
jgi:transcriptional regulator with XRE-family HTH domain